MKAGDFNGLSNITTLDLYNNKLTSLPSNVFAGLNSLTTLNLDHNKLSSLPPNVFAGLNSVTYLTLNNNNLTSLHPNVFAGLTSLGEVTLQNNALTCLPNIPSSVHTLSLPDGKQKSDYSTCGTGGLVLSKANVLVPEGSTATYTVKLYNQPSANVTVAVAKKTTGTQDQNLTVSAGSLLTFTSSNWNTAKTVRLAAAEDADGDAGTAVIDHTAAVATPITITSSAA